MRTGAALRSGVASQPVGAGRAEKNSGQTRFGLKGVQQEAFEKFLSQEGE